MRVRDIMTQNPITARPTERVSRALAVMRENGFKHLPILSESGHLIGITSLEDCRVALGMTQVNGNIPDSDLQVNAIMRHAPIVTGPCEDVFKAAQLMYENRINSLPVMLEETLVGIMTSSDLLIACLQLTQEVAMRGL